MTTATSTDTLLNHSGFTTGIKEIDNLDLDSIKFKLMDSKEGLGWSREKVDEVETAYKVFLLLNLQHPDHAIVPSHEIDEFWHAHILDTRKYAEDCNTIFGYFLHHFPYFGMRGEDDARKLQTAFQETREMFAGLGIPMTSAATCDKCGSGCGAARIDDPRFHQRPTLGRVG